MFRFVRILVGSVFLLAGIAKVTDPSETVNVLWWLGQSAISSWTAQVSTGLLVSVEIALGLALLSTAASRWQLVTSAVLLGVFSCVLVLLLVSGPEAPDCGCLGAIGQVLDAQQTALVGLIRNLALIGLVTLAVVRGFSTDSQPERAGAAEEQRE